MKANNNITYVKITWSQKNNHNMGINHNMGKASTKHIVI